MGDDVVYESPLLGLLSSDVVAGEQELEGPDRRTCGPEP